MTYTCTLDSRNKKLFFRKNERLQKKKRVKMSSVPDHLRDTMECEKSKALLLADALHAASQSSKRIEQVRHELQETFQVYRERVEAQMSSIQARLNKCMAKKLRCQTKIKEMVRTNRDANGAISRMTNELETCNASTANLQNMLSSLQTQFDTVQGQYTQCMTEREACTSQYSILQRQFEQQRDELAAQRAVEQQLRAEIAQCNTLRMTYEEQIAQKDTQIEELERTIRDLMANAEEGANRNAVIEAEHERVVNEFRASLAERAASIQQLQEELDARGATIEERNAVIAQRDASIAEGDERERQYRYTISDLQRQLEDCHQGRDGLTQQVQLLQETILQKEGEIATMRMERDRLIQTHADELARMRANSQSLEEQLAICNTQKGLLEERVRERQVALDETMERSDATIGQLRSDVERLERALMEESKQVESYTNQVDQLTREQREERRLYEDLIQDSKARVTTLSTTLSETRAALTSIETSLVLQNEECKIATSNLEQTRAQLAMKEEELVRLQAENARFISINSELSVSSSRAAGLKDLVDTLKTSLVSSRQSIEERDRLLAEIRMEKEAVMEELKETTRQLKSAQDENNTQVDRSRQLDDLQRECKMRNAVLDEEIRILTNQSSSVEERANTLQIELQLARAEIVQQTNVLTTLTEEKEKLQRRADASREEVETLTTSAAVLERRVAQYEEEKAILLTQQSDLQNRLTSLEEMLLSANTNVAENSVAYSSLQNKYDDLTSSYNNLQTKLEETDVLLQTAKQQERQCVSDLRDANTRLEDTERSLQVMKHENTVMGDTHRLQIDGFQSRIDGLNVALDEHKNAMVKLQGEFDAKVRIMSKELELAKGRKKLAMSELAAEMESLKTLHMEETMAIQQTLMNSERKLQETQKQLEVLTTSDKKMRAAFLKAATKVNKMNDKIKKYKEQISLLKAGQPLSPSAHEALSQLAFEHPEEAKSLAVDVVEVEKESEKFASVVAQAQNTFDGLRNENAEMLHEIDTHKESVAKLTREIEQEFKDQQSMIDAEMKVLQQVKEMKRAELEQKSQYENISQQFNQLCLASEGDATKCLQTIIENYPALNPEAVTKTEPTFISPTKEQLGVIPSSRSKSKTQKTPTPMTPKRDDKGKKSSSDKGTKTSDLPKGQMKITQMKDFPYQPLSLSKKPETPKKELKQTTLTSALTKKSSNTKPLSQKEMKAISETFKERYASQFNPHGLKAMQSRVKHSAGITDEVVMEEVENYLKHKKVVDEQLTNIKNLSTKRARAEEKDDRYKKHFQYCQTIINKVGSDVTKDHINAVSKKALEEDTAAKEFNKKVSIGIAVPKKEYEGREKLREVCDSFVNFVDGLASNVLVSRPSSPSYDEE